MAPPLAHFSCFRESERGEGGREGDALAVGGEGEGLRVERAGVEHPRLAATETEEVDPGLAVLLAEEAQGGAVRRPGRPGGRVGREGELPGLAALRRDHPESAWPPSSRPSDRGRRRSRGRSRPRASPPGRGASYERCRRRGCRPGRGRPRRPREARPARGRWGGRRRSWPRAATRRGGGRGTVQRRTGSWPCILRRVEVTCRRPGGAGGRGHLRDAHVREPWDTGDASWSISCCFQSFFTPPTPCAPRGAVGQDRHQGARRADAEPLAEGGTRWNA